MKRAYGTPGRGSSWIHGINSAGIICLIPTVFGAGYNESSDDKT